MIKLIFAIFLLACVVSISSAVSDQEMANVTIDLFNIITQKGYDAVIMKYPSDYSSLNMTLMTNKSDEAALFAASPICNG